MRRQKNSGSARPKASIDYLVEKVSKLTGCSSLPELFQRATLACSCKKLDIKKAAAACTRFLKEGHLVHWVSRIIHKVARGRLTLPALRPSTV